MHVDLSGRKAALPLVRGKGTDIVSTLVCIPNMLVGDILTRTFEIWHSITHADVQARHDDSNPVIPLSTGISP